MSLLPSDPPSEPYRHITTKGKKQKHLKLFIHPPSIPTRFQTFHFDDNEEKGFNSTAPRFNNHLDELPGPGYCERFNPTSTLLILKAHFLDKNKDVAIEFDASLSKRGYGVGFASQTRRLKKPATDNEYRPDLPGPGEYTTTKEVQYSYSLSNSISRNFRQNIAKVTSPSNPAAPSHTLSPGPASYNTFDASKALLRTRAEESGAAYVFKSKTNRPEINNAESVPGRDAPPPGAYNLPDEKNPKAGATAAFKATIRSGFKVTSPAAVGPGSYDVVTKPVIPPKKLRMKFKSVVDAQSDQNYHRDAGSLGPGQYEVARATDTLHRHAGVPHGVFVSASPRFGYQKTVAPPPGFYRPLPETKNRSFHLNLTSSWLA
ncbi:hypothetical protein BC830DRAFT_1125895 [Chytriomyces sp. MP71]|nr:hypothetical protein BC830DRAFT_1125895 [Chytriomyces sp. MP71]